MKMIPPWLRLGAAFCVASFAVSSARADFYVAPAAQGTATGTSAANAASYLNLTFWNSTVKPALSSAAQTVWLTNGTYNAGQLKLTSVGHPLNKLTIKATTGGSVTMSTTSAFQGILWLYGCQNVEVNGIRFTGAPSQNAVNLSFYPTILKSGSRNLTITGCWFENLTNLSLGAIITGANHGVTIDGCHFTRVTGPAPKQVHAIYGGGAGQGFSILGCDFTDIGGEYVRFRNDTEFAIVDSCSFHSTSAAWNSPFIGVPLYNSIAPSANEFYGTNFQFSNNVFRYDAPNPAPPSDSYCFAHYIYDSGYNAPAGDGLDYMLDTTEAATLNTGTVAAKEALLSAEMGLTNARFKIVNPEYHGATWATAYRGYGAAAQSYTNPVNISDWPAASGSLATAPILRNGQFEFKGSRLRCWYLFSGSAPVDHPGLGSTAKAIRLASSSNSEFGQWMKPANPSQVTIHCLFAIGSFTGTGVKFQVQVYHNEISNSYLAFAVNDAGQCGYMNGSTFVAVPALGTILFSTDANADGDYADAGDTLRWYQLRITVDYTTATPTFSLARGVANTASDYTYSASGLTGWVNGAPPTGSKAGLLNFANTTANVVVDECW
jgi:hypothetical protein